MRKSKSTKSEVTKVGEPAVAYSKKVQAAVSVSSLLDVEASRVTEPLNRVSIFRKGFRKKSFDRLKEVTGLDYQTLALALSVSTKTLQRKQIFDVVQSEKMYELAELYAMGITYFGEEGFKRWMDRPLFSLGNIRPLELIDVSQGVDLLKTEIMRVQHGIAV
jgi:putative toxin-antitoxin system antitoxin component (TIGR02293 family)